MSETVFVPVAGALYDVVGLVAAGAVAPDSAERLRYVLLAIGSTGVTVAAG